MVTKHDLYRQVTDHIVAELEKGVAPWVRPWKTLDPQFGGGPFNGYTKRAYRGINILILLLAATKKVYGDPRWLTFRQALALGAHVRRGEQGTQVIFWKQHRVQESDSASDEKRDRTVPLLRSYVVFNAEQCDGIAPLPKLDEAPRELRYKEVAALVQRHPVDIRVGGDRAFFSPTLDFIQMPTVEAFFAEEGYWGTMLHELTHWTGHPSRLHRTLTGRFGSMAYAAEELVAEMGSAFLCASLGIEGCLQHPEYIGNWLTVLRDDKRAVFTASGLAQAAADYVLGRNEVVASEPEDAESQQVP